MYSLDGCSKATLEHDIHSGNQLHVLMSLVDSAPQFTDELERIQYGENLKNTVISFTSDLIPHMEEEEEVCQWVELHNGQRNGKHASICITIAFISCNST